MDGHLAGGGVAAGDGHGDRGIVVFQSGEVFLPELSVGVVRGLGLASSAAAASL